MEDNKKPYNQLALLKLISDMTSGKASDDYYKASPPEFKKIVTDSASSNPMIKANVTDYSEDDYKKMKTFLSGDKKSGYAIKPKDMTEAKLRDELISVFSNEKGRGKDILEHAVDVGKAKQLDAFDINNKLPSLYGKEFKETSRYKFDPQYAPDDWNYNKLGTPDVIGMELDNSPKKLATRTARQAGKALSKFGIPVAAIAGSLDPRSVEDTLSNLLVPGGVESIGSSEDDDRLIAERLANKEYERSSARKDRLEALKKLSNKN